MAALRKFYQACQSPKKAVCCTAYDYPTALVAREAGMDLILISDTTAVYSQGLERTTSMSLDEMIYHCKAVSRAAKGNAFLLADLPFGSYEISAQQAVESALRLVKEGNVDGVQMEGGAEIAHQVEAVTRVGVPVVAHIGLTPQRALMYLKSDYIDHHNHNHHRPHIDKKDRPTFSPTTTTTTKSACSVLNDARDLQLAGAVAIMMEAVAEEAASVITRSLQVPTIGVGSGKGVTAQMVFAAEVLGYPNCKLQRWHKQYADLTETSIKALKAYKDDCEADNFPGPEHVYHMKEGHFLAF